MHKAGRNEPCPCGSGTKYKKCCLDKDQAANVIRLAGGPGQPAGGTAPAARPGQTAVTLEAPRLLQASPAKPVTAQSLLESLKWEDSIYKVIAQRVAAEMEPAYEQSEVLRAIQLWHAFSSDTKPVVRKIEVFPAAVEYLFAEQCLNGPVTQTQLARKYGVSSGTISARAGQICEYMDEIVLSETADAPAGTPDIQFGRTPEMEELQRVLNEQTFDTLEQAQAFIDNYMQQYNASLGADKPLVLK